PVATADLDVPGGGKIAGALGAWVNNKNRTLLLAVGLQGSDDYGLYRFADGQRTPLLLPGQEMPGGGKYKTLASEDSVSFASEAGEHAFLARLDDGPTAAYLLGADGKLSLILKSGATTDLGKIANVGQGAGDSWGIGLNSKGQVALTVKPEGGVDTIV